MTKKQRGPKKGGRGGSRPPSGPVSAPEAAAPASPPAGAGSKSAESARRSTSAPPGPAPAPPAASPGAGRGVVLLLAAVGAILAVLAAGAYFLLRQPDGSLPPVAESDAKPEIAAAVDWMAPGLAMTERLAAIQRAVEVDPTENRFANVERVRRLEAMGEPADPTARLNYLSELSYERLYAGDSEAAIQGFREVEAALARSVDPADDTLKEIRMLLAMALLRLGEQVNCIQLHSADACLLPLRGSGVHQFQDPARQAATLYEEVLAQDPGDLTARWMLNIAYMAVGEYPAGVPPDLLVPAARLASEADIGRFKDVAPELGLDVVGNAGGSVLDDLDNDGDLDVAFSTQSLTGQLTYFVNNGDGTFTERTREARLEGLWGGLYMNQTDYDNDGDLDLFVPRGAWLGEEGRHPNSLLANNGDGTFTDVTEAAGLLSFHPTQVGAWADFDIDGDLDLFVGNESVNPDAIPLAFGQTAPRQHRIHPCELFRNNGDGTFTNVSTLVGLDVVDFVKGAAWGDYDNDGLPDLYVSVDGGPNRLFHNDGPDERGGWRFREVTHQAGVAQPVFSFSTWFFDYDNDGWLDILAADYGEPRMGRTPEYLAGLLGLATEGDRPYLYHNNGDGTFTEVGAEVGLDTPTFTMGSNYGDLDNDGWLDIYLATGDPWFESLLPNRAFRNDAGRRFQEVTDSAGLGHIQKGHGISFGDVDHDGDQDILDNQGGAYAGDGYQNVLFLNPGQGNQWLTLLLEGTRANRPAIGARVKVVVDTPAGRREIHSLVGSGSSFGGNSLRQEIGLGDATAVDAVEVAWPGGETERFAGLAVNRAYRVRQGEAAAEEVALRPIPLGSAPR